MKMIDLKEWDWNAQKFEEVPYPQHIIKEFIDYLRETKAWREDLDIMHRRFLTMTRDLTAYKNGEGEGPHPASIPIEERMRKVEEEAKKAGARDLRPETALAESLHVLPTPDSAPRGETDLVAPELRRETMTELIEGATSPLDVTFPEGAQP